MNVHESWYISLNFCLLSANANLYIDTNVQHFIEVQARIQAENTKVQNECEKCSFSYLIYYGMHIIRSQWKKKKIV